MTLPPLSPSAFEDWTVKARIHAAAAESPLAHRRIDEAVNLLGVHPIRASLRLLDSFEESVGVQHEDSVALARRLAAIDHPAVASLVSMYGFAPHQIKVLSAVWVDNAGFPGQTNPPSAVYVEFDGTCGRCGQAIYGDHEVLVTCRLADFDVLPGFDAECAECAELIPVAVPPSVLSQLAEDNPAVVLS